MRRLTYTLQAGQSCKVQDYLRRQGFSGTLLAYLKQREGRLLCNGKHIRTVDMLSPFDQLEVTLDDEENDLIPNPALTAEILYQDPDLVIYNKPAAMPVHPCRNHRTDTLGNLFAVSYPNCVFRPVNRLDRDTSGACLAALHALAGAKLSGKTYKVYLAVVSGRLPTDRGTIDAPILRTDYTGIARQVGEGGQPAVTHYQVVAGNADYTAVRVWLETGRTHQIRVHFCHLGFPLAGDRLYGGSLERMDRQALHCMQMSFVHPVTETEISVQAEIPVDMQNAFPFLQNWA
ncbi:MAG TPA: RluA family pseudouridine synthase [Firmicutes bacterium]|nr:RluA family pseudouridine synthase [Bacillota bacterium]